MEKSKLFILAAIIIIFLAVLLRFAFLTADPFPYTNFEATWFDEGAYAHNARNLIIFNELSIENDLWNPIYFSPIHTLLLVFSFKLFGIGTFSMRLVPAILILLSSLFLGFSLYKKNKFEGIIFLILLLINPMLIAYSRISIAESSLLFFIMIIFGLMINERNYSWILIGALMPFLFFAKISSIFFVAALPISLLAHRIFYKSKKSMRNLKALVTGSIISSFLWLLWLIPNFDNWIFMNLGTHGDRIGDTLIGLVVASLRSLEFLLLNPLIVILSAFFFINLLFKMIRTRLKYIEMFFITLIAIFIFQLILIDYSLRRFVLLLPILIFFSIKLISEIKDFSLNYNNETFEFNSKKILLAFTLIYIILSIAFLTPLYVNIAKDKESSHVLIRNSEEIAQIIPSGEKVYGKHALALGIENEVKPYFGAYLNPLGNKDANILPQLEAKEINYAILKLNLFDEKDLKEYDRDIEKSGIYLHLYNNFEVIEEIESITTNTNEPDTIYIYKRKN